MFFFSFFFMFFVLFQRHWFKRGHTLGAMAKWIWCYSGIFYGDWHASSKAWASALIPASRRSEMSWPFPVWIGVILFDQ